MMTSDLIAIVVNQPDGELKSIIGQALGEEATPVGELSAKPTGSSAVHATQGISHVSGRAHTAHGDKAWSSVVQILGENVTLRLVA